MPSKSFDGISALTLIDKTAGQVDGFLRLFAQRMDRDAILVTWPNLCRNLDMLDDCCHSDSPVSIFAYELIIKFLQEISEQVLMESESMHTAATLIPSDSLFFPSICSLQVAFPKGIASHSVIEICGENGSGKTHLAIAMLYDLLTANDMTSIGWIDIEGTASRDHIRMILTPRHEHLTGSSQLMNAEGTLPPDGIANLKHIAARGGTLSAVLSALEALEETECIFIDSIGAAARNSSGSQALSPIIKALLRRRRRGRGTILVNQVSGITGTLEPALGLDWASFINVRLWLTARKEDTFCIGHGIRLLRTIVDCYIQKGDFLGPRTLHLEVGDYGLVDRDEV